MDDLIFYILFGLTICWLIYGFWSRPKCEKCKVYLKLLRAEDPLGINITNKIQINFVRGIPRKEKCYYLCPSCGQKKVIENTVW